MERRQKISMISAVSAVRGFGMSSANLVELSAPKILQRWVEVRLCGMKHQNLFMDSVGVKAVSF